jgi:hypothetical protein
MRAMLSGTRRMDESRTCVVKKREKGVGGSHQRPDIEVGTAVAQVE